jgi:hypothetical protein
MKPGGEIHDKIETGVLPLVRSEYARILLDMAVGQCVVVRSHRRLHCYRAAALRYGVAIRTQKQKLMWRIWKLGDSRPTQNIVDTRVFIQNKPNMRGRWR